ncbi:DoxX family membrane protein [Heliobacterium gestii]|uniref:DoxX family membrane protein n=1 Tax=Heliomicrobium gestii TaxID=2699 RepID=A0A845LH22_HELGE|nr:DoxX family membrane protein [Heliomicrobium gestii]MBM7867451.1 thiosulfate dehydrogenase [quinone] large subunit [Heliomicrobium gestii]MZP43715.1 DoxX family membrane protein [Heliomicrobium gestii]
MEILRRSNMAFLWLLVRLWVGYEWLTSGLEKVTSPAWTGENAGAAVTGFLNGALAKAGEGAHPEVHGWYADFIRAVALPNAKLFSYLVSYGELLVGLALIAGLFTYFAALAGAIMNLAYLWAGTSSTNPEMLALELLLLTAGPVVWAIGLDRFLMPFLRKRISPG